MTNTLHGNILCVHCGGKHDGHNLVKRHAKTSEPVHVLCLDGYDDVHGITTERDER